MTALTERKKADRAQMATAVAMLAASLGAAVEIEREGENSICPRRVMVGIRAARGLCVSVDFDGQSCQPDVHVISWHMSTDCDTCFADTFERAAGLNRYHFRKATAVAYDFDALLVSLAAGLELAQSGAAFDDAREAAAIAKRGETAGQHAAVLERAFAANKAAGVNALNGPAFDLDCESAIAFIELWAPGGIPLAVSSDGRRVVAAGSLAAAA